MLTAPFTEDLIGPGTQEGNTENSDLPGWAIGVIVGAILLVGGPGRGLGGWVLGGAAGAALQAGPQNPLPRHRLLWLPCSAVCTCMPCHPLR